MLPETGFPGPKAATTIAERARQVYEYNGRPPAGHVMPSVVLGTVRRTDGLLPAPARLTGR